MSPTPSDVPNASEPLNQPIAIPGLPEWAKMPPLIARGNLQFKRDLPDLLKRYRGQWVAYSGEERLGIAADFRKLYKIADRRGLKIKEYVLREIEEWDPDEIDPEEYVNK